MTKISVGTLVTYPVAVTSTMILLDGKHFRIAKRPHTLYVAQDAITGAPFAWVLLARYELRGGYDQILDWLRSNGLVVEAVVSDSHKGLAASVADYYPGAVHQRCSAHVLRTVLSRLGGRWFLGLSDRREFWKEITYIVLGCASYAEAVDHLAWINERVPTHLHDKWLKALSVLEMNLPNLYKFTQRPDLAIPRTSNRMEALMGSLQQRLKTCRGFENPETLTTLVSSLLVEKIPTKK
jgi:transposase-like protein